MKIPPQQLAADTLNALIESWLMREGEDWALNSLSLDQAALQAKDALLGGKLVLVWHAESDSFNILAAEDYREE